MIKNLDFISKEFENILVKFSLAKLLATGEVPVPIYTTGVNIEVAKPRVKHPPTTVTKEFKNKLLVVKIPQYLNISVVFFTIIYVYHKNLAPGTKNEWDKQTWMFWRHLGTF